MKTGRWVVAGLGFWVACAAQGCGCGGGSSEAPVAGVVEEAGPPSGSEGWTKVDTSPKPEGRDPSVLKLKDGSYRMWYRTGNPVATLQDSRQNASIALVQPKYALVSYESLVLYSPPAISMTSSKDGLAWDKSLSLFTAVKGGDVGSPCVLFDGTTYRMWFREMDGYKDTSISYAESADGATWKLWGALLGRGAAGSIDEMGVGDPHVVQVAPGSLVMLYTAIDAGFKARIGRATSQDGIKWTKSSLPALEAGPSGTWDEGGVSDPSLLFDGVYRLWYVGRGTADKIDRIGYAESPDGATWTKYGKAVLDAGNLSAFDQDGVGDPFVLKEGAAFRMWYAGRSLNTFSIGTAANP